jgi:hypothetical protein
MASSSSSSSSRDCVLYRYTGTTVEYILGIIDFETSVGGLYFEGVTNVGTKNYFIQKNEKMINGFHIVADKNKWISSADPSTTTFESNEQTLILCIGDQQSQIYTTTGNVTINIDFNIIHTTTVFIKFNNRQYIPNVKSISSYAFASNSASGNSVVTIDSLTREMTSIDMRRLLFFLNCVDISKMKTLQRNSGIDDKTIAHFINLLMVEIKLDSKNIVLNSNLLTDLDKENIIIDSSLTTNNPISNLLMHLDSFSGTMYNSYDVYSNAGLNFTKIVKLQKKTEYKPTIDAIIAKYRKQVADFKEYIKSIQDKPQFASIMVEMQNYVLKETARPKNVVIINVKTRGLDQADLNGVRNPMNLRYSVSTNLSGNLLKIDAVDSSYPLYDKQDLRPLDSLVSKTGGEVTDANGKPVFNRKTKLVCGPFDDIVDPDNNNFQISQTPIFAEIKNKLRTDRYVCMFGKGISGSGKTSTLIYNLYGDGLDGQIGALFHLCKDLKRDSNFNCSRIELKRSELCADPIVCDTDDEIYKFEWQSETGQIPGFYCTDPKTFQTIHINDKTKECTRGTCDIVGKPLYEVAELLLTKTRLVRTTPLNPSSSRSHSSLTMKLICMDTDRNPFDCFLTVVDAAGREKVVECGYGILVRLANAFADTEENKNLQGNEKERSYHNEGSTIKTTLDRSTSLSRIPSESRGPAPQGPPRVDLSKSAGGGGGSNTRTSNVPKVRPDIDDFTQVDKLIPLLMSSSSNSNQRVKDVLHVLGGCKTKFDDDIISDTKLNILLSEHRDKYLQEINPNSGSSSQNQPALVRTLEPIIKKLPKTSKENVWIARSDKKEEAILPSEMTNWNDKTKGLINENTQYIIGVFTTKNAGSKQHIYSGKTYIRSNGELKSESNTEKLIVQVLGGTGERTAKVMQEGGAGREDFYIGLPSTSSTFKPTPILVNKGTKYVKNEVYVFKEYEMPQGLDKINDIIEANNETYEEMYKEYDKSIETQKTEFDKWKTGKLPSIELFVTPNHKIHLGHVSEYRDDLTPTVTKFMTKFSMPQDKQQFYNDARAISTQLDTFFTVTNYIRGECDKLSAQGRFINQELTNADSVINSICVRQNGGKPTMPPYGILNNNEYYEEVHVYNILKSVASNEDITKSVSRSQIIQSMFNMIVSLSGSQNATPITYAEIANKISFFFFTIINLSPDTEMPNRVQYHHIQDLRKLLKKMKYESEFVEDYAEKRQTYNAEFNKHTTEITKYYTTQKLQNVTEILALSNNIAKATSALANSTNYEQAIKIVETIVFEINSINGSTIIGSIANDGDTCILQDEAGLTDPFNNWKPIVPTPIR